MSLLPLRFVVRLTARLHGCAHPPLPAGCRPPQTLRKLQRGGGCNAGPGPVPHRAVQQHREAAAQRVRTQTPHRRFAFCPSRDVLDVVVSLCACVSVCLCMCTSRRTTQSFSFGTSTRPALPSGAKTTSAVRFILPMLQPSAKRAPSFSVRRLRFHCGTVQQLLTLWFVNSLLGPVWFRQAK